MDDGKNYLVDVTYCDNELAPGSVTVRAVPRDTDNDLTALGDSVTFNVYVKVTKNGTLQVV